MENNTRGSPEVSMPPLSADDIARLVEPDRVHRAVYTDPALFDLEMDRLFGRAWLVLGHESQIKNPGDFFRSRMGRQPVIVTRHTDGSVQVLVNRCAHRGSTVCEPASGSVRQFVCPYHGWTYGTDGALCVVPFAEGYDPPATSRPDLGLARVPRVDSYRGFLFASLATDGPSLLEFLGHVRTSFDDLVDRAPAGRVEVAGGVFKHTYRGNWKLVIENHLDLVHPAFVHASSIWSAREAASAGGNGYADIAVRQMLANGVAPEHWEGTGLWAAPYGHAFMGDYHTDDRLVTALDHPVFREYRAALERRVGTEEATRILGVSRFNTIVYPSCSFMSQFRQLRIVQPLAVDHTVVYAYSFRLEGAPEQMFRDTVAFANVVNGTGSPVLTDDLEVYERLQRGLTAERSDWVYLGRRYGQDVADRHDLRRGATGTSDVVIRNYFAAWVRSMTEEK
jgi:phenylpropionate dioxygenase-like ring-hydroxylating dioxygenase large terminal subunit